MNVLEAVGVFGETFAGAFPGNVMQGLIWGIMAIGVFITYKILDFADLTVDGTLSLGGIVAVVLITNGVPVHVAMLISFASGCAAGLCTALLNTVFGIPGILSGILTQLALWSVFLSVSGGHANMGISARAYPVVVSMGKVTAGNSIFNILCTIGIGLAYVAVIIAVLYWFFGTEYGMAIRATGGNSSMSKAEGINTKMTTVVALVISNGLVGLSGALIAQYQGNADASMGKGAIVVGLASVIIGMVLGEIIFKKKFNFICKLIFTVLGAVIYYNVISIVTLLGLPNAYTRMVSAIIVALFLAVPYLQKTSKTSFRKAGKRSLAAVTDEAEHLGAVLANSVTSPKKEGK
ncbi:MAG: ABC transporter permease [Ruminococcaceae bacterium]|nr:ABC transporter permease [Oscillospiraceae bacterium]